MSGLIELRFFTFVMLTSTVCVETNNGRSRVETYGAGRRRRLWERAQV